MPPVRPTGRRVFNQQIVNTAPAVHRRAVFQGGEEEPESQRGDGRGEAGRDAQAGGRGEGAERARRKAQHGKGRGVGRRARGGGRGEAGAGRGERRDREGGGESAGRRKGRGAGRRARGGGRGEAGAGRRARGEANGGTGKEAESQRGEGRGAARGETGAETGGENGDREGVNGDSAARTSDNINMRGAAGCRLRAAASKPLLRDNNHRAATSEPPLQSRLRAAASGYGRCGTPRRRCPRAVCRGCSAGGGSPYGR